MPKPRLLWLLLIVLLATVAIFVLQGKIQTRKPSQAPVKISIATMPLSFTGYTIYVAHEKGFFSDEGLEVSLRPYSNGKATLKALANKEVDMATSSETPFMHAVLKGDEIYAFASMITADKHLAVVARKDRRISKPEDLRGKTIGVTLGTNGEYFLDTVLLLHGVPRESIKTVNLEPGRMYDALTKKEVDAIATWNPQMYKSQKRLGGNASVFYADGLYTPFFIISAGKQYVNAKPETIEKTVRALVRASDYIRNNMEESNMIASRHIKMDKTLIRELSSTYYYFVTLDQALVLTLENQFEWALKNKMTERRTAANFLDFVYTGALSVVKPESMSIIQ